MKIEIKSSYNTNLFREVRIKLNSFEVETPIFFPSISSCGLKISLDTLSSIINNYDFPRALVSCYDVDKYAKNGNGPFSFLMKKDDHITFYDCGCYESHWLLDTKWTFDKYKSVIQKYKPNMFTSFDIYKTHDMNYEDYRKLTFDTISNSINLSDDSIMLSILHNTDDNKIFELIENFLIEEIIEVNAIAISERDLGHNILEVIKKIKFIRDIINKYDENIILHILGCGDPKSIMLYIYCGADSFDSRDWAKHTVNINNYMTYPLNYLNLLNCNCNVCKDVANIDYISKLLLHNLLFYENYFNTIKQWISRNVFKENLINIVSQEALNKIDKI